MGMKDKYVTDYNRLGGELSRFASKHKKARVKKAKAKQVKRKKKRK